MEQSITLPLRDRAVTDQPVAIADVHGATDRGVVRERNEDQLAIQRLPRGGMFAVADGMGGHGAGNIASAVVLQSMQRFVTGEVIPLTAELDARDMRIGRALVRGVNEAQDRLLDLARLAHLAEVKPGTTLTLGFVVDDYLHLVHAGDSRCYLLREGVLRQLTRDHNLAERMFERDDPTAAAQSPLRNVLYNCVGGGNRDLAPDTVCLPLAPRDTILLCTDGVSGFVPEDQIAEIVAAADTAERTCARLIDAANDAGGRDNATAIVIRFG